MHVRDPRGVKYFFRHGEKQSAGRVRMNEGPGFSLDEPLKKEERIQVEGLADPVNLDHFYSLLIGLRAVLPSYDLHIIPELGLFAREIVVDRLKTVRRLTIGRIVPC